MNKMWIGIAAVVGIALLAGLWYVSTYNSLVASDQNVQGKWAQVEAQYQRRVDLIPNLVATVKGASNFESETLEELTRLRSQWQTQSSQQGKVETANQLESTISKLLLVTENYPELKATQAYQDLLVQLEGTENRVAFARGEYNIAVQSYNTQVRSMPTNIVAGMNGFTLKEFFEAEAGAEEAPTVTFQ